MRPPIMSPNLGTTRAAIRPGFPGFVLVWRPSGGRPGGVSRSVRGKPGHFSCRRHRRVACSLIRGGHY
ncbi:hypothetical protein B5X24_HaOG204800 [Helicoverpa armigera]|uniref:Uncharacterized protein n=1 Tax=Helicoverpa armigera TaxID=29058 RepID=A0A2W1BMX9_HELAM|nr:hypothetical protein B5X24_HaOG204800 [Helicoverpa armigera]